VGQGVFKDAQKSPLKALLLCHLNLGCMQFDQCKECDAHCDGELADMDGTVEEIKEEGLSEKELGNLVLRFALCHSFADADLISCSACGLCMMERTADGAEDQQRIWNPVECAKLHLSDDAVNLSKYSEAQALECESQKQKPPILIPVDENWTTKEAHPHKICSVHESEWCGLFHLHPKLVTQDADGAEKIWICRQCLHFLEFIESRGAS